MAVDPNRPPGLPQAGPGGLPPDPAADPALAGGPPGMAPPAPTFPTTDPQSMMGVLEAVRAQDQMAFQQQQDGALANAVAQLLRQSPNQAGEAATTMPGSPTPPPLPGDPSAGGDPLAAGAGAGY